MEKIPKFLLQRHQKRGEVNEEKKVNIYVSFHMTSLELTTAKADDGYMGVQFSIFSTFVYV